MSKRQELIGSRFHRLLVLARAPNPKGGTRSFWECVCDCGNKATVAGTNLLTGNTHSCGCYKRDAHWRTHGLSHTPEYGVWLTMKNRCKDPTHISYRYYGAKGVKVCERWMRFENFITDVGRRPSNKHTIERINSGGDYEPGNCTWELPKVQSNNRISFNVRITIDGETRTLSQWCDYYGQDYKLAYKRIAVRGWDPLRALTEQSKRKGQK